MAGCEAEEAPDRRGLSRPALVAAAVGAVLAAGALAAAPAPAHAACPAPAAGYVTVVRTALAGPTLYTVPSGVTSVHVCAVGGTGGATTGAPFPTPGGAGDEIQADARVLPGQVLFLDAGRNGAEGTPTGPLGPVLGQAAGGGGSESSFGEITGTGGQGGGVSYVAVGDDPSGASAFLAVAGGGGGAGQPSSDYLAQGATDVPFFFPGGAGGGAAAKGANGPTSGFHGEPGGAGGLPGGDSLAGAPGLGAKDPLAPKTCGNDGHAGAGGQALTVPSPGGAGGAAGYPGLGTSGSGISLQCVGHPTVTKGMVVASLGGGGGGGSGWTGGGGGGGGAGSSFTGLDPVVGAGGGGGGGSSHVDAVLTSNGVHAADTTHAPMAEVRYPVARAAVSPAGGLAFAPPPAGAASAPQSVVITDRGAAPLTVGPPGLGGSDPQDFRVASDTCSAGPVHPGGSCAIGVVFSPQAAGPRSARLLAATNDPGALSLSVPLRGGAAAGGGAVTGGRTAPRLALRGGVVILSAGGGAGRLAAVCRLDGGGVCRVTGVLLRVRTRHPSLVLAHVTGRLRAGRRGVLAVRLTAAGRRLLAGGPLRATLRGVVRAGGLRGVLSGVVRLRARSRR